MENRESNMQCEIIIGTVERTGSQFFLINYNCDMNVDHSRVSSYQTCTIICYVICPTIPSKLQKTLLFLSN